MSFELIKNLFDERRFNDLVGRDEDTWFEAKGRAAYDLDSPGGRYELAKDVSAFANAEGGFLVVGLTTLPSAETRSERVTAHDLCPQEEFDVNRYLGVINEYVHPTLKNLNVRWLPIEDGATHGLGVIEVPVQSSNQKYFLIANVVESGAALKQIVFGIAKRTDSSNDPLSIAEIYKCTQSGKSSVPQTLARVEEKLDRILGMANSSPVASNPDELYAERVSRILEQDAL